MIYRLLPARNKEHRNGQRQGGLPGPSPHAFVVKPGNVSFEAMVQSIDEGIIVEQLLGAGQGNSLGGDFSGNVLLGYKIEKGEIVGRVKDTMISGNVYQLLKNIAAIGSDAKMGQRLHVNAVHLLRRRLRRQPVG